jgi:hypothetical protein
LHERPRKELPREPLRHLRACRIGDAEKEQRRMGRDGMDHGWHAVGDAAVAFVFES